ncbi:MAG: RNA-binding S4 domain-containing protein [Saprospiraceae bacterium]|nr:RNA-binding S4 domain-containing protein [Saprospiraceae bacterium]
MKEDYFTLRPTDEFIELVKLLKLKQIAQTGGHAKMMVEEGLVKVNGELEFRKRKKLRAGDRIEIEDNSIAIRSESPQVDGI